MVAAWIHTGEAVQQLAENVVLCDLARLQGTDALLARIEEGVGGIYAWYRRFKFNDAVLNEPEKFIAYILDEIHKKHSMERDARLAPAHRVQLSANTVFSKEEELKVCAADPLFRQLLLTLLENSLIFQQPLYIGKATNIHARISDHLKGASVLRRRLNDAGHDIDNCRLLLLYMRGEPSSLEIESDSVELDDDDSEIEGAQSTTEVLIEDIVSRLFLPTFTARYG